MSYHQIPSETGTKKFIKGILYTPDEVGSMIETYRSLLIQGLYSLAQIELIPLEFLQKLKGVLNVSPEEHTEALNITTDNSTNVSNNRLEINTLDSIKSALIILLETKNLPYPIVMEALHILKIDLTKRDRSYLEIYFFSEFYRNNIPRESLVINLKFLGISLKLEDEEMLNILDGINSRTEQ